MKKFEHFSDHEIEKTDVQVVGELLSTGTLISHVAQGQWTDVSPLIIEATPLPNEAAELARSRDGWEGAAAQYLEGMHFYQSLLDQIARSLGEEAFRSDDGVLHDSPIRIKLPEMVAALVKEQHEH